jgi:alkanesulfonate monooxygenase SsuD/methylene tetrahydromethanopterin reductase-like flavin-dependent oxidoreductase (luciferase family)
MTAVGVPMEGRGTRSDEYLAAMRSLWEDEAPALHGRHVDFDGVDAHPRPVQRPIPVVIGGHTAAAHRRAARDADGWYGFMLGLRAMAAQRDSLRDAVGRAGRKRPLHISVTPARRLDADVVRSYSDLGVDRLIVAPPPGLSADELVDFVESNAPSRLGASLA